jgi:hypothetical protein
MAKSPDISALAAYAGTFEQQLIVALLNGLDVVNDITVDQGIKVKKTLTKLKVKAGARPFTSTFEPLGDELVYTPRVIEVEKGKYELSIDPSIYRDSYLIQFGTPGSNSAAKAKESDIPFAQFAWQEVIKKLASELNDDVVMEGIGQENITAYSEAATYAIGDVVSFGTPTQYYQANAATLAGEDPNDTPAKWDKVNAKAIAKGFETTLLEEIAAAAFSETVIGAIDNSTVKAFDAQLALYRDHDTPLRKNGVVHFQSYTDYDLLLDDLRNTLKYTLADIQSMMAPGGGIYLPYTERKCIAKPVSWNGTRRIMSTRRENLIMGTDLLSDFNGIGTDEHIYTLDAAINFVIGFQFRDLDVLRTNDI